MFLYVCRYDSEKDNFIDLMELKLMMEKLGAPQTHMGLKNMIKEVDEDLDGKLNFREVNEHVMFNMLCRSTWFITIHCLPFNFVIAISNVFHSILQFLLIFRKAAAGELAEDSGLSVLARLSEIDVSTEGVKGAKSFFEAKVMHYFSVFFHFLQCTIE